MYRNHIYDYDITNTKKNPSICNSRVPGGSTSFFLSQLLIFFLIGVVHLWMDMSENSRTGCKEGGTPRLVGAPRGWHSRCSCTCIHTQLLLIYTYIYMCMLTYASVCRASRAADTVAAHVHIYIYMYVYIYIYMCVCVYIYIYIYVWASRAAEYIYI